jgi:hypothetical protein
MRLAGSKKGKIALPRRSFDQERGNEVLSFHYSAASPQQGNVFI